MALNLKTVLHEIVEHLDLSPAHRAQLHEDVDLHDDLGGQFEQALNADPSTPQGA